MYIYIYIWERAGDAPSQIPAIYFQISVCYHVIRGYTEKMSERKRERDAKRERGGEKEREGERETYTEGARGRKHEGERERARAKISFPLSHVRSRSLSLIPFKWDRYIDRRHSLSLIALSLSFPLNEIKGMRESENEIKGMRFSEISFPLSHFRSR